jgi:DNA modification methylase
MKSVGTLAHWNAKHWVDLMDYLLENQLGQVTRGAQATFRDLLNDQQREKIIQLKNQMLLDPFSFVRPERNFLNFNEKTFKPDSFPFVQDKVIDTVQPYVIKINNLKTVAPPPSPADQQLMTGVIHSQTEVQGVSAQDASQSMEQVGLPEASESESETLEQAQVEFEAQDDEEVQITGVNFASSSGGTSSVKSSIRTRSSAGSSEVKLEDAQASIGKFFSSFRKDYTLVQEDVFTWYRQEPSKQFKEKVDLILTDPPYNIMRKDRSTKILDERDFISDLQMQEFCRIAKYLLAPHGSGFIFCHEDQIVKWKTFLRGCNFDVDLHSMTFVLHRNYINQRKFSQNLVNVKQNCVVFHNNKDYYRNFDKTKVAGQLPVYCNVVVEVKGVSGGYLKPSSCKEMQDELFKDPSRFNITSASNIPNSAIIAATESEFDLEDLEEEVEPESLADPSKKADDPSNKKLRPQEKSDDYYSRIIECYSKSGDLVFDGFAGTFSCGVSCVKLHRKFIGVERDPEVFKPAVARLFSEYAGKAKWIPLVNNKACAGCSLFKELSEGFCSAECKEAYDLNVKAAQASIGNGNFLTSSYLFTPLPTHVVMTYKSLGWSDADINSLFSYPVSHFCLLDSVSAAIPEELIQKDRLEQLFKAESNFYSGNFEVKSSKLDGSGVYICCQGPKEREHYWNFVWPLLLDE